MKKTLLAAAAAAALALAAFLLLTRQGVEFSGDRIANEDRFLLRFDVLNTRESGTLTLEAGAELRVSWEITGGSVDVAVGRAGEEPIYQAMNRGKGDGADFTLTIPESGEYTLSVSGKNAKGQIEFKKAQPE
ncbi:MAG: hypothetical protein IJS53_03430 [Clostridia bacterium]|nr:hypothetical protein [Clostridia bacterium]